MSNFRILVTATVLLNAAGCGSGHVSPHYEAYRAPTPGCDLSGETADELIQHPGIEGIQGFLRGERVLQQAQTYRYMIDALPHCTRRVLVRDGRASRTDFLPPVVDNPAWFSGEDTVELTAGLYPGKLDLRSIPEACWFERDEGLHPAWMFEGIVDGEPKRWFASGDTVYREDTVSFFVDGVASIYESNPGSPKIDVALPELDSSGFLRSPRFLTDIPKEFPRARAAAPDYRFDFDPKDVRFNEVSVFANAERMAAFLQREEFGYDMNCLPIHLRVPDRAKKSDGAWRPVNNAAYIPPSFNSEGSFALIRIGEGDGIGLQSLTQDADVIFHEIGHHVVFRTLKSTAYKSRLIHEAVADYFLFAKTNNACVGEGICPAGSEDCWEANCLRNGNNDMSFADDGLPSGYHQRSQILSGMMWDLRKKIGDNPMDRIVFKAVDFFLWESDYQDFVYALMAADQELFQGVNACAIFAAALERGLEDELADLACQDFMK